MPASSSRYSDPTAWSLLDEFASIGHRKNATTATGSTSARHHVEVSFELVDPPRGSRWFVHCPALETKGGFNGHPQILPVLATSGGFNGPPQILNTVDGLVLLRMVFFTDKGRVTDYFVYRAGPGKPSLDLIPGPYPQALFPKQIGILPGGRGSNEHYFVVFPVPRFRPRPLAKYEIHVFSSESKAWSNKVARISSDPEMNNHAVVMHVASKAVAAGRGELAWIDLWRGVLLCNVLDEDPSLRLLQWPVPPPRDVLIDMYSARSIRDATVKNGIIRFVESKFDDGGEAHNAKGAGWTWRANLWSRDIAAGNWSKCSEADVAKILSTQTVLGDGTKELDLHKVLSAPPILSLQNDDDVYFITKLKTGNPRALLLAVNARKERLEAARPTSSLTCCPCTIIRFIGADNARQPRKGTRREKENLEPLALSVALAREQLMQIEKCITYNQPNYHLCRSLLNTGPLSCLHVNFQGVKDDANINNQQQPSLNAMTLYQRTMRDIDKLAAQGDLSAHLKGKIGVAIDALDKLLQTVPGILMEDRRVQLQRPRHAVSGRVQRPRHTSVNGTGIAKELVSRS